MDHHERKRQLSQIEYIALGLTGTEQLQKRLRLMDKLRMLTMVLDIGGLDKCSTEFHEGRRRERSIEVLASCLPCTKGSANTVGY